jgi:putative sigma-54 modulation protein
LAEDEMKIQIRGRNIAVTKVVRTRMERRLGFALGRFGERIDRVLLRFSDANGDRGDVDKRCQIDVGLRPRSVRVEHTDADLFVALDHAADRASRSVARALEREREYEESPRWRAGYPRVKR